MADIVVGTRGGILEQPDEACCPWITDVEVAGERVIEIGGAMRKTQYRRSGGGRPVGQFLKRSESNFRRRF